MKNLKNKKGFTLIELLAVIVILAIVTVVATRSILPYMTSAGKDAFTSEANLAITGASDAVSLIQLGEGGTNYYYKEDNNTITAYCFTKENLDALGVWQKDDDTYALQVVVTIPSNGNAYTYALNMHSDEYAVTSQKGTIQNSIVYDYNEDSDTLKYDCSGYTKKS